ncbi:inorganic pyrophosphatase [Neolewinella antarctica]|uniref:Inorganic pyrophosphatase n=1 Tax=Neolewinella antarctica TaxID=442734 RepID=A0ABX0X9C8_9BACT|nr:inorganic pyrophosphatase [Neolewinella antarctica]NJC25792.1 inorganic pyrophosphatase [Neolewinella antarctica]
MASEAYDKLWKLIGLRYASHPWHGIEIGSRAPDILTSFIEVIPSDTVKYEIDKKSGFLMIDRPQKFSNIVPALYGFIPQTYCMDAVADYCMKQTGREGIVGDGDPLDICVLTEREITHGNIIVKARPIGGFRMLDGGEADDKIIAVLENDEVYDKWRDIEDLPQSILRRLQHYFLTYKQLPSEAPKCEITHVYGAEEAKIVIQASRKDYQEHYGNLEEVMSSTLMEAMRLGQRRDTILGDL